MPVSLHLMWVPWGCPLSQVRRVAGSAALVLVDGVTPLRPEPALFESMLEGWGRQQRSRRLSGPLIVAIPWNREHLRLVDSCNFRASSDYRTPVHFVP